MLGTIIALYLTLSCRGRGVIKNSFVMIINCNGEHFFCVALANNVSIEILADLNIKSHINSLYHLLRRIYSKRLKNNLFRRGRWFVLPRPITTMYTFLFFRIFILSNREKVLALAALDKSVG